MDGWRLTREPGLDGIRAVGVLLVIGIHAGVSGFGGGGYGVDIFFALSGFLITSILAAELTDTGRVRLRRFWIRRALRLLPALIVLVAVCWLFADRLRAGDTRAAVLPTLLYYANWHRITGGGSGGLAHTWSLSIEEQFYVVWPAVMIVLARIDRTLRAVMWFAVIGAVASAGARFAAIAAGVRPGRWYNDSFMRADCILIGCAFALYLHIYGVPAWMRRRDAGWLAVAAFAAIMVRTVTLPSPGPFESIERFAVGVVTVLAIGSIVGGQSPFDAAMSHPVARWIGVRSYGLYLWHFPLMRNLDIDMRSGDVVWAIGLTFLVAGLSYRYVEAPFLRLKERLAGVADDHNPGTAIAARGRPGAGRATAATASVRSAIDAGSTAVTTAAGPTSTVRGSTSTTTATRVGH